MERIKNLIELSMKKTVFTVAVLMLSCVLSGQETGSFLSVSGGLGGGGFQYTPIGLSSNGSSKDKLGWNAKIDYSYYFTPNWGVSTGVGIASYRTIGRYNDLFESNKYYALGKQVDDDFRPGEAHSYELRVRLQNWQEEQKGYFIELPVRAVFQYKLGEQKKHGFYAGLGVKFQLPVSGQYRVLNGKDANDTRLNVSGKYDHDPTLDIGDPNEPFVPSHGFGSISDLSQLGWKNDLNLKMSIAATADLGFLFGLSRRVDLMVGGFFDYGFNNIKKGADKTYMEAPAEYLPGAANNLGNGIQYNGMVNTDRTNKVNLMSYGGKIGLHIKLGKLSEPEVDTIPLPEMFIDTFLVDNSDLDSLLLQLNEMRGMLQGLFTEPEVVEPEPVPEPEPEPEAPVILQGIVLDSKTRMPLAALVELTDLRTNQLVAITRTDSITGKFKFPLQTGGNFILDVRKEGYMYYSETVNIPNMNTQQVVDRIALLNKIEVNQVIILKNIFFDTGKSTLKPQSMAEIDNVYRLMIDNPTMSLEISGHTDNVGSEALNKKLSLARASVVVQTLISKGISPDRLTSAGYGYDQPIAPNTTVEGRAQNRRTEFKVTKM
jgi:outer membrane protein OmpA-like peptidoglycan-associated protein